MNMRLVVGCSGWAVLMLGFAGQSLGVGLSRNSSWTDANTYAWILTVGADADTDQGTYSASCDSHVMDYNDGTGDGIGDSVADVAATASPASSLFKQASIYGTTFSDSYLAGGWYDNWGNWQVGTTQSFQSSVESNYTVTSAGTLAVTIGLDFDSGHYGADGSFYGSVTAGDVDVYFTWSGGATLSVEEYLNGTLTSSYDLTTSNGEFHYSKNFPQTVTVGKSIDLDTTFVATDNNNFQQVTKTVSIFGAMN